MDKGERILREIIREEIKAALLAMNAHAIREKGHQTDHIEAVALDAVHQVAWSVSQVMHHDPECSERVEQGWSALKCSCGADAREDGR